MALGFFTDLAMTKPISLAKLKRFCIPLSGGSKTSVVYFGDPYNTKLAQVTTAGATTVYLNDTSEFLASGTVTLNGVNFTYTGVSSNSLTGCSGVPSATIESIVIPSKVYKSLSNISVSPVGAGFASNFNIQLSTNYPTVPFGFSQNSVIYSETFIAMNVATPLYIKVNVEPGAQQEITGWSLITCTVYVKDSSDSSAITVSHAGQVATMYGYVYQAMQSPEINQRIIQLSRKVTNINPGFTVGQYRWRTTNQVNEYGFIPPNWNLDPLALGTSKFQSGIGYDSDLELVDLANQNSSIYPVLNPGQYFYEPFRTYLPVTTQVDIFPANSLTFQLTKTPTSQTPIQVGVWKLDSNNSYVPQLSFTYVATTLNGDGTARTDLPTNYFTVNRYTNVVTVNTTLADTTVFIGSVTGTTTTFDLPYYPVNTITTAYCDYGGSKPRAYASSITIDSVNRKVSLTIPGSLPGDIAFINFPTNLAIIYDVGAKYGTRTETSVDLNPAYSGLAGGIYYIEQRIRETEYITLTCDKPIINIPPTFYSVVNLQAFGPVYLTNDYALLTGQAFTNSPGEIMPNAQLKVITSSNFTGLINYINPNTEEVIVITGGDGKVNLVYTPAGNGGYFIPDTTATGSLAGTATTTITNDSLVLPTPVPISQIWNTSEGWLVYTYNVYNDKPFYGQVSPVVAVGEIPYVTTGTPGQANYSSNGAVVIWQDGAGNVVYPINAFDSLGNSYTSGSFNGNVKKLVYATALTSASDIPIYYIDFLQRVTIQLQDINTGIVSNTILLQMQYPNIINDNPWLYLDSSTEGLLNAFRLGWISPGV